MKLDFLNRENELERIRRALARRDGALLCLYGRRRIGKSRLLTELLKGRRAVYYVADERDASLQREALAREAAALFPGFDEVGYPDWEALFQRWWREAPKGAVFVLDEFPVLVRASSELPSILQKLVDRSDLPGRHVVLCGSSQRMMHGLVLDASAPLYGRADEVIRLGPLGLSSLKAAFRLRSAASAVEHHAVWGGVPRYWELALDYADLESAVEGLLLDPLGVLHHEPDRLLMDDLRGTARTASILALVGQGCHRVSEMAGRLKVPATSLSRPLAWLMDLGLLAREVPFGRSIRDTKRTYYRIADPLMRFWYRYVEPNRSRLAAGQVAQVRKIVSQTWSQFLGMAWEQLARESVPKLRIAGCHWLPASRWWGGGTDGRPLEMDVVAQASDRADRVLVGEAKVTCTVGQARGLLERIRGKASRCPALAGKRVTCALWVLRLRGGRQNLPVVTARQVVAAD